MRRPASPPRPARRGFTLVEVLIVVVILGILAATVLPQFTSATEDAKESALKQNLQQIRSQIDLYKFQHNGSNPPGAAAADFYKAMLCTTDVNGTTDGTVTGAAAATLGTKAFGPYLLGQFPPNPYTGKNTVSIAATKPVDEATGWWYNATTGEVRPNLANTRLASDDVTQLNNF